MNWNWDHIRFFLALAEHGTLSTAGKSLGVSHSTVLRRIRAFEDQLQSQLFDHTNDGYSLTTAGRSLHVEARKMQGTLSALSREISGADGSLVGEVAITTTDTLARYVLPKLLAKLTRKYEGIRFSLFMANSMSDINNREADIAIRTCKVPPENLIGRKVGEIEFCVVASRSYVKQHGLSSLPESIADHSYIMLDDSYSSSPFYQWFEKRVDVQGKYTKVNNFLSAAALTREGMGITVLPSYVLANESTLVKLDTSDKITSNDLWVLSHSDLRATEKVRVVRQYLYDELPRFLAAS
ncbi:MAG: LysR family transcriptional regulator [Granulosicoccus sp.]